MLINKVPKNPMVVSSLRPFLKTDRIKEWKTINQSISEKDSKLLIRELKTLNNSADLK